MEINKDQLIENIEQEKQKYDIIGKMSIAAQTMGAMQSLFPTYEERVRRYMSSEDMWRSESEFSFGAYLISIGNSYIEDAMGRLHKYGLDNHEIKYRQGLFIKAFDQYWKVLFGCSAKRFVSGGSLVGNNDTLQKIFTFLMYSNVDVHWSDDGDQVIMTRCKEFKMENCRNCKKFGTDHCPASKDYIDPLRHGCMGFQWDEDVKQTYIDNGISIED